jgi:hypothetical protein
MAADPLAANLVQGFELGYRNREDPTTLNPNVLVKGSQNVLTNTYKRIGSRNGYQLDGQRDSSASGVGIYGSYDWNTHLGTERNVRVGFNTTGTNGVVQYRYVASAGDKYKTSTFTAGQVYWIDLYTTAGSTFNACRFWDFSHELKDLMLWVDGTSNIFMWSGGITTVKATTWGGATGTIQKNGGGTWASSGFLSTGFFNQQVTINGNNYIYISGADTDTLVVTTDPTGEAVNSVAHQRPVTTANSAMGGLPTTFKNSLIENLNNQIYVAASDNNSVYISQLNTFQAYTFSSPRKVGEGAILTLDGVPSCLQQQSDSMFISAGKNYWYSTKFQISSDNINEVLSIVPIKTTANQACRADGLSTKIKNLIAFVSYETQVNTLGISANFFTDAQVSDISGPIVHDVEETDFTDGHIMYFQKYLFLTAPKSGRMYIFNMTLDTTDGLVDSNNTHYWEAPQTFPFGRLSIIGGQLYGHGYGESNTFKLFTGTTDDTKPYKCLALFAYNTYGDRTATKSSNELFFEGHKFQDTKLTAYLRREWNGPVASWSWKALPDNNIVPVVDDISLGKVSIGKVPIGGSGKIAEPTVEPKFRIVQTFNKVPFFEEQVGFGSEGVGQKWELVSFSTNATLTTEGQNSIYDPPQAI